MKRSAILTVILGSMVSGAMAQTSWLKITTKDEVETCLVSDGLTMSVSGDKLVCKGSADEISFDLANLKSMEFTDKSGMTGIEATRVETPVEVYNISGILAGRYPSLQQAREALSDRPGVYVVKSSSQTVKITVK